MSSRLSSIFAALVLLAGTASAQYSALTQLGASGVTTTGGSGKTNMLVKTGTNGIIDASLVPRVPAAKLSGLVYIDPVSGTDTESDPSAGSILQPYKTVQFALDRAGGDLEVFLCSSVSESVTNTACTNLAFSGVPNANLLHLTATNNASLVLTLDGIVLSSLSAPTNATSTTRMKVCLRNGGNVIGITSTNACAVIYSDAAGVQISGSYPNVEYRAYVTSDFISFQPAGSAWWWANGFGNTSVSNALDTLAGMLPAGADNDQVLTWINANSGGYWAWTTDYASKAWVSNHVSSYILGQSFITRAYLESNYPTKTSISVLVTNTIDGIIQSSQTLATKDYVAEQLAPYAKTSDVKTIVTNSDDVATWVDGRITNRLDSYTASQLPAAATNAVEDILTGVFDLDGDIPTATQGLRTGFTNAVGEVVSNAFETWTGTNIEGAVSAELNDRFVQQASRDTPPSIDPPQLYSAYSIWNNFAWVSESVSSNIIAFSDSSSQTFGSNELYSAGTVWSNFAKQVQFQSVSNTVSNLTERVEELESDVLGYLPATSEEAGGATNWTVVDKVIFTNSPISADVVGSQFEISGVIGGATRIRGLSASSEETVVLDSGYDTGATNHPNAMLRSGDNNITVNATNGTSITGPVVFSNTVSVASPDRIIVGGGTNLSTYVSNAVSSVSNIPEVPVFTNTVTGQIANVALSNGPIQLFVYNELDTGAKYIRLPEPTTFTYGELTILFQQYQEDGSKYFDIHADYVEQTDFATSKPWTNGINSGFSDLRLWELKFEHPPVGSYWILMQAIEY